MLVGLCAQVVLSFTCYMGVVAGVQGLPSFFLFLQILLFFKEASILGVQKGTEWMTQLYFKEPMGDKTVDFFFLILFQLGLPV